MFHNHYLLGEGFSMYKLLLIQNQPHFPHQTNRAIGPDPFQSISMVHHTGLEPMTPRLKVECSTN